MSSRWQAVEGAATGVVIAIGDHTIIGRIAGLAGATGSAETPIRREIHHFIKIITVIAGVLGISLFVAAVAGQHISGRLRLAKIMAEHGKASPQAGIVNGGLLQRHQQMYSGVYFRMPFACLRYAEQGVNFREQPLQCTDFT